MDPIQRLEKEYQNFTRSEQIIADFIIQNPLSVIRFSLTEVAKQSRSSNTAIIRLCKKLGYHGFSEFKFSLSRSALSDSNSVSMPKNDVSQSALMSIVTQYVSYLNQMAERTDIHEIIKIASLICRCSRLAIMGYNRTGFSASQLSYRLGKLGLANHLITDRVVMQDYMEILTTGDACIIFSITANHYTDICQRIKKNGASLILFTMNDLTPLRKYCNHVICLPQISYNKKMGFLDDQAIFFVFIEVLLREAAAILNTDFS